jgi:rhomboid family GlyGly-CTERM serine protease
MPAKAERVATARVYRYVTVATISLLAIVAEAFGDPGRLALRYQRDLVGEGEIWRLVTGHLVHLGFSHLAMNLVALTILSLLFTRLLKPLDWLWVFLLSAAAIDAGLFWFNPEVTWYVGLSGVLHGFWGAAAVQAFAHHRREAALLTALIVVKLVYEAWIGPIGFTGAIASGPVITQAHAYGAIGGTAFALSMLAIRSPKRWL